MATAAPTICCTIRTNAKQQFGTSTIIRSLATPPVRPSWPVGISPRLDTQQSAERIPTRVLATASSEARIFRVRILLRRESKFFRWDFLVESSNSQETQQEDIYARRKDW